MVNIKLDGLHANISFDGAGMDLALELGVAISGIYQGLYSQDEESAEAFKFSMQRIMEDGGPMWDRSHKMTVVTIPKIN